MQCVQSLPCAILHIHWLWFLWIALDLLSTFNLKGSRYAVDASLTYLSRERSDHWCFRSKMNWVRLWLEDISGSPVSCHSWKRTVSGHLCLRMSSSHVCIKLHDNAAIVIRQPNISNCPCRKLLKYIVCEIREIILLLPRYAVTVLRDLRIGLPERITYSQRHVTSTGSHSLVQYGTRKMTFIEIIQCYRQPRRSIRDIYNSWVLLTFHRMDGWMDF